MTPLAEHVPALSGTFLPRRFKPITEETFDSILAAMSAGTPTHAALRSHSVGCQSFYGTIDTDPAKAARYAHARECSYDRIAEDAIRIADDDSLDPNSRRVMVDTRKWFLSKLCSKRYGDKLELSGDSANPLTIVVSAQDDKL